MNLIHNQAYIFYNHVFEVRESYEKFIPKVRSKLNDYHKISQRLEFVNHLLACIKDEYDDHLIDCKYKDKPNECPTNQNYEHILFFMQNEKDILLEQLPAANFTFQERDKTSEALEEVIYKLNLLQIGQEINFEELSELKNYYFIPKRNWMEMLIGKITALVSAGVINETVSKEIVEIIKGNFK